MNGGPGDKGKKSKPSQAGKIQEAKAKSVDRMNLLKEGWEAYRKHLDEKGLFGDPRLNTGFGKTTFNTWAKANPQYGLNWNTLPVVGRELQAQKQGVIGALEKGLITMDIPASEYNPSEAVNLKTKNPWWPGVEFTAQFFPTHSEAILDPKGKVLKKQDYGVMSASEKYTKPRITQ